MCAKKGKTILIRQDDYVCNTANISNEFTMKYIILKTLNDMPKVNKNNSKFLEIIIHQDLLYWYYTSHKRGIS